MQPEQPAMTATDSEVDIYNDGEGEGEGGGGGGEQQQHYKQIFKILIIGDSNVGKTALLTRFVEGRFQNVFMSTVGIDYKNKVITVEENRIKLQIWDTAGQERFRTLTNAYFRGAAGAVLLYDITSRSTFINVLSWMDSIREHGSPLIKIALVGHKIDLEDDRQVSVEEGQKLADTYNCLFFESSSRAGKNCSEIFTILAQEIKKAKDESNFLKAHNSTPFENSRVQLGDSGGSTASSGSHTRTKTSCCRP